MAQRKFRFGVQTNGTTTLPPDNDSGHFQHRWARLARCAEDLGYSTLTIPDHFDNQIAPMPALAAAAAATSSLRVGSIVWCNDYKHPLVLAKEIATLDLLSGGRAQLGLGAGWMKSDYAQAGIPYDAPGQRIDRMIEALAILRGHFGLGPFKHQGKHYQIEEMDGIPKPVQKPIPIFIGGGGKRMLSVAAREGDIVGINVDLRAGEGALQKAATANSDATAEKVGWVREAAGARYGDLEINVLAYATVVTDNRDEALKQLSATFHVPPDQLLEIPHVLVGSVDQIVADLERRRDQFDMSYVVIRADQMHAFAPVLGRLAGN
jgi:probable F420-dependent oxidoreductase